MLRLICSLHHFRYILWVILVGSILAECFADNWKTWIAAKLLAGAGVGMLQVSGLAAVKLY